MLRLNGGFIYYKCASCGVEEDITDLCWELAKYSYLNPPRVEMEAAYQIIVLKSFEYRETLEQEHRMIKVAIKDVKEMSG